jgi:hypothetical protein
VKRVLASVAVVAAVGAGFATPASAFGACDEKVEVLCNKTPCAPGDVCSINFCLVYTAPRCVV